MTCSATQAASTDWHIFPSTCINDEPGDICRLEISVSFPESLQQSPQTVCFYLDEQKLECLISSAEGARLSVTLAESQLLNITIDDQITWQKQLVVQSMKPKNKRRRVRNPWSFF